MLSHQDAQPRTPSAKVPSPSSLGHAIDDAVVYLGESATAKDAKRVAEQIVGSLPRDPVLATPPGMEPLIGGASYSEHRARTSTSHGAARASVVAEAVKRKLAGSKKSMPKLMGEALKTEGYDPKQPSRLAKPGLAERLAKKLIK